VASLIFPAPLETEATREETLALIFQARPDSTIVSLPSVVLGTEWEKNHAHYGIELDRSDSLGLKFLHYRCRFTYPPLLWDPLPYQINGKTFVEFSKESHKFTMELEKDGLFTQLTDEMWLMAHRSGLSIAEFRDRCRLYIATGDALQLQQMVQRINRGAAPMVS
jgi:hypothetical protein